MIDFLIKIRPNLQFLVKFLLFFLLIIFDAALKTHSASADVAGICSIFSTRSKYQDTLLNLLNTTVIGQLYSFVCLFSKVSF